MFRTILCLAAIGGFAGCPTVLHAQGHAKAIDDLARRTLQQWQLPGVAVAIVRDDRLIYLKGFGVRAAGKPAPVTPDTIFPLASCTKSFTTLAMGMLVDEDKLDWDDPVRQHVPYFHLADPLADASVTLRDLVTHRTGVAAHDLLWYQVPWTLEERIRRAGKLDLAQPFRSAFQYQVVLFGAAGVAVGAASGGTWQDFVQKRILDALEMKASRCAFPGGDPSAELASPHRKGLGGKVAPIARYPLDAPDPAGSIHSTARDLSRYLRFQLGDGTWQGKRLISATSLAEPQTAQIVLRHAGVTKLMNPETLFLNYGMGWVVQDYRGKLLLMHGGSIDGFRTHLTLVPEARLGVALLSNLEGGFANLALSNSIVDLFLGAPAKDWSSYYLDLHETAERDERARAKELRDKRSANGPPRPLGAYAGTYSDPAYGSCRIELEKGYLVWSWNKVRCPLEYYKGDTFLANYGPLVDARFVFTPGPSGRAESLSAVGRIFERK